MNDDEPRTEEEEMAPAGSGGEEEKLDLAAVAAHLAARSREPESDPAIEAVPAGAGEEEAPPEPETEEGEGEGEQTGPEIKVGGRELSGAEVYAAVEALLFAADKPVTAAQIARALPPGVNAREVRSQLKAVQEELAAGERGFELREIAGGWQLLTRERFGEYVAKLRRATSARKLSGSALETLAVVAYKQPVARAEIERIRGVACGDMLRNLLEKRLVRITGRSSELGSALLYGTTPEFLDHFGLASIGDLPRSAELGRKPKPGEPAVRPPAGGGGEPPPAESGEGAPAGEAESAPPAQSPEPSETAAGAESGTGGEAPPP